MSNVMPGQMSATIANDDYDWDSDGQLKRGPTGVNILRPSSDAVVKKPSWFGKETVFRPYPYLSDARDSNSPFEPYRIVDNNRNKFSNWIRRYICAWNVGTQPTTFLIKRPVGAQVFDSASTPLGILYRAVSNAIKRGQAHPEWPALIMKMAGKSPPLEGPKECYLMQGALFRHDGKDYFGQYGDPLGFGKNQPLVLLTSGGAGSDLCQKLSEEHDNYHGDPQDFESRYKFGDPVSCNSGRFIHFFEKGRNPYQNRYASQPQNPMNDDGGWGAGASGNAKKTKEIGFDVYVSPDFEGLPARFNAAAERVVRNKIRAWDDMLYFPTETEQAHMLFRCFPVSACMYAFETVNKDWIPEDAYKRLSNATSVSFQGTNNSGYAQAPGFGQAPPAPTWGAPQRPPQPQPQPSTWNTAPAPAPMPVPKQDNTVPQDCVDAVNTSFGFKATDPDEVEPDAPEAVAPPSPPTSKKTIDKAADVVC